jgi:DNA-binding transcriptional ArsR family regulator
MKKLNAVNCRKAYKILKLFEHKNTRTVIRHLQKNYSSSVRDIQILLRFNYHSTASHFINKLYKLNIIDKHRKGKNVYCSINKEKLEEYKIIFNKISQL